MRDIDWLFLVLTLFNTNIGLNNQEKNREQHQHLDEINAKLDKILEVMNHE